MYNRMISFAFAVIFLSLCFTPSYIFAATDLQNGKQNSWGTGVGGDNDRPVLTVTPREIDLGSIKPGESVFGEFSLKNIFRQTIEWSATCPEDWESLGGRTLRGTVSDVPGYLSLELNVADPSGTEENERAGTQSFRTTIKLESGGKEFACYKELKAGTYRKAIKISSAGGQRNVHLGFRIRALQEVPSINLNPKRLDLGVQVPGKFISRRIELTNRGREMLRWNVISQKPKTALLQAELPKEKYVSFRNEQIIEPGKYVIPDHLKDSIELVGRWSETNGYPVTRGNVGALKFKFSGTGISLFLQSHTEDGSCLVYLDENLVTLPDVLAGEWEKKELIVAEKLPEGMHTVSIVIKGGSLELEGAKIFGKEIKRGLSGWITVFPNSGTTMSETDYINVKIDTSNLDPGYYGDEIVFRSNAGEEKAEVFVEIATDGAPKVIDVYLYSNNLDYLFTSDPQSESKRLIQNRYIKEGIAFRLFAANTPGTTNFYRWYNPSIHDHFYHYDRAGGGKKLNGYVYEGIVGNIATSRMTNTHELYRWYNPLTQKHYYSTNPKAATGVRKGYKFDGIAGYVR